MFEKLFKRKEPYDYGKALQDIPFACFQHKEYDSILASINYNASAQAYEVSFKCAVKEYSKKDDYFLALRRREKFTGTNLEVLLKCVIEYMSSPTAFTQLPAEDSLPEGITFHSKEFVRIPRKNAFFYGL